MERKELICIGCPLGCNLTVGMDGGQVVSVNGNTCKRGDDYARSKKNRDIDSAGSWRQSAGGIGKNGIRYSEGKNPGMSVCIKRSDTYRTGSDR